jgi:tetratricopeptide (TPR) repeat protein
VLLGEDLYLFDLKLGLPIPSETGEGIATLREVMAKPAMLEQLAVSEKYPYQIASEDLTEVVALLDVLAVNLAQRTALVEQHLIGEHRTVLTVPLSELAGKLGKSPGVSDVYIWSVPFAAMQQLVQEDNQVALRYFQTRSMFQNQTPLARGRVAYLRGDIDSEEEREGAKVLLMQARVPQTQLEDLASDEDVQKHLGMSRDERTSPQQWAMQMEMFKQILTLSKQHASMWLGLCQLETGRPDAAIEWFGTRTLEAFPNGFWTPLARYDLARCYEMQGKLAEAQRLLLEDKSLQEHGNYLRARMLEKRLAAPAAADAPPPNAADAP